MLTNNIVVIDDDKEFLEEIKDALSSNHYSVTTVNDPVLALEVIEKVKPVLILLDLNMPGKNGFEVARQMRSREKCRDIPIIIISGRTDDLSKYMAAKVGAVEALGKPLNMDRLQFHIKDILSKRKAGKGKNN